MSDMFGEDWEGLLKIGVGCMAGLILLAGVLFGLALALLFVALR